MKNITFIIAVAGAVLFSATAANGQLFLKSLGPIAGTSVDVADGGPVVENGYGQAVNSQGWEDQYEFPSLAAAITPSVGSTLVLYSIFQLSLGTSTFPLYTISFDLTQNFTVAQYTTLIKTPVGTATAVVQPDLHTVYVTGTDGYVTAAQKANVDLVFGYAGFNPTYFDNSKTVLTFVVPEPRSSVILLAAILTGVVVWGRRRKGRLT